MHRRLLRTISLVASLGCGVLNVALAARVLASWRSLKWDLDSESDALRVDAVKLAWGLLVLYFASAATACIIGFIGIARNRLRYVRFFRDYSIADFMFVLVTAVTVAYVSFSSPSVRAGVCEELGRQPELMRDLSDSGLNLENCEYWFERAVFAVIGMLSVFVAIRLHFVIALSRYYTLLRRDRQGPRCLSSVRTGQPKVDSMQRIYLLPTPTSPTSAAFKQFSPNANAADVLVFAPVPVGRLSVEDAKELHATEAWISAPPSKEKSHRHHRHHHSSSTSSINSGGRSHRHHRSSTSVPRAQIPYRDDVAEPLLDAAKENEAN